MTVLVVSFVVWMLYGSAKWTNFDLYFCWWGAIATYFSETFIIVSMLIPEFEGAKIILLVIVTVTSKQSWSS